MVAGYCNDSESAVAEPSCSLPGPTCSLATGLHDLSSLPASASSTLLGTSSQPAKVIIIGDGKVGKTALLVRFLTRRFIGHYKSNADIRYSYSLDSLAGCTNGQNGPQSWNPLGHTITRRHLAVEFLDVSNSPIEDHLDTADASFVIVYNICERSSFLTAKRAVWMIRKLREANRAPVLLVGNKKDLADAHRQVTFEEVERLSYDCDAIALETSAASDSAGVTAAFNRLLAETHQFVDQLRRSQVAVCPDDTSSNRRRSSLTLLSSLTQMFAKRSSRTRRKPRTL